MTISARISASFHHINRNTTSSSTTVADPSGLSITRDIFGNQQGLHQQHYQ
jgi:hypothetical protein